MVAWLATQGHHVNRKRERPMRLLGLAAIYQRPNTSKPAAAHRSIRTCQCCYFSLLSA
jgi:putative transposase